MQPKTFSQLIQSSQTKLNQVLNLTASESRFETQLLLLHVIDKSRAWLIAHDNDALPIESEASFQTLLNRRLNGEPIAYILGYREFYGLSLKVTPDTLIPRPDTETLIEAALAKISQNPLSSAPVILNSSTIDSSDNASVLSLTCNHEYQSGCNTASNPFKILDLGTGTGAIALAIAKNCPLANIIAVDVNKVTLDVAIENCKNLDISNVQFILSDWLSALTNQKFDLIVSNPPYIEADDSHLQLGDLRFEPLSALASGSDGLDDIRHIINCAPVHLNANGWLMLEHGYNQAEQVATLLKQAGFSDVSHVLDLGGIQRVTIGKLSGINQHQTPI